MTNDLALKLEIPALGGEFIKLKNSGKVFRWTAFDQKTQTIEYRSESGEVCTVHQRDTETPSTHEELECLKKEISN
jgi:hypothetical protein